jgi:microcystin-dependent protein
VPAVGAVLGAMLLGSTAGCADLDDAGQGVTRNDLVTDLAVQLGRSTSLTYSATYQLAGGATATVVQAQQPARSALLYPDGRVTVTTDATTECRTAEKALTCTMTPPPASTVPVPATLFAGAERHGMVNPTAVLNMLNTAALDADVSVVQHDTTIAGRHATCVDVGDGADAPASRFQACITNDGVLGSFTGVLNGDAVDVAMTAFDSAADGAVFDPPPTATVIDRRRR